MEPFVYRPSQIDVKSYENSSSFKQLRMKLPNPFVPTDFSSQVYQKPKPLDPPSFSYYTKNPAFNSPQTTINNSIPKFSKANIFDPVKKSEKPVIDVLKSNSFVSNLNNSNLNQPFVSKYNNSFATSDKQTENIKNPIGIPNHEPTKYSVKKNGVVKAYAANTNQGLVRNYNEDRVSIILNITKPNNRGEENWPKSSFFGVYDGHGGVYCADYLRDNLHQFVIKDSNFPNNPKEALKRGFEQAEQNFQALAQSHENNFDRSGSCAIVVLIVGENCYVANVGDSRAVMSCENGVKVCQLSRDHKPLDEIENKRIQEAGGKIYQTKFNNNNNDGQKFVGPHRVLPGRLSVTRTFGDIEAKLTKFGGNPKVIIAIPDIKTFKITPDNEFIILGSDGIFDKLSSKDVIQCVWESINQEKKGKNIHEQCAFGVESIMKDALINKTLDNITVVMICFDGLKKKLFKKRKQSDLIAKNQDIIPIDNLKKIELPLFENHSKKIEYPLYEDLSKKNDFLKSSFKKSDYPSETPFFDAYKSSLNSVNYDQNKKIEHLSMGKNNNYGQNTELMQRIRSPDSINNKPAFSYEKKDITSPNFDKKELISSKITTSVNNLNTHKHINDYLQNLKSPLVNASSSNRSDIFKKKLGNEGWEIKKDILTGKLTILNDFK